MNTFKLALSTVLLSSLVACSGMSTNISTNPTPNNSKPTVSKDPDTQASDYLIFGSFYGHCRGETCIETFKLKKGQLFEDTVDDYNHKSFNFQPLYKYQHVKHLRSIIPTEVLLQQPETIGCPDCADAGGVYVQLQDKGVTRSWKIDNDLNNVPKELHSFVKSIQNSVRLLEEKEKPTDDAIMCPANFQPICVTEVVNGKEISNTYSNSCMYTKERKGTFVISTKEGACD